MTPLEPPDKLDASPRAAVVNGPAGGLVDWHESMCRDDNVRRLLTGRFAASA